MLMAGPKSISTKISMKYRRDGLGELFRSGLRTPQYISEYIIQEIATQYIVNKIKDRIVCREDLYCSKTEGVLSYGEEEQIELNWKKSDLPESVQSIAGEYHRSKPQLREFSNAKVLWNGCPALTETDEILLETTENETDILKHRIRTALSEMPIRVILSDIHGKIDRTFHEPCPLFLIVRHPSTNYYHWIVEYLPKLRAFDEYNRQNNNVSRLLIEQDPPDWVTESIELMGYNSDQWVNWENQSAKVEQLLVPEHSSRTPGTPHLPSPSDCTFVTDRMTSAIQRKESTKKIFISRQKAEDRRIDNFSEVEDLLTKAGYETYTLEEMSVRDQVQLFSQAEVVIGAHGAGLTNIIFGDDLKIIEIFPDTDIREHYFYLSNIYSHDHNYLIGDQVGADVWIDSTQLQDLISK